MQNKSEKNIRRTLRNNKRRRQLTRLAGVLSALVVLIVVGSLMQPASTMTTICGHEEHTHSDECYTLKLICGQDTGGGHTHSDDCYERVLTCGKTEHVHTDACYPAATAEPEPEITEAPAPEPNPEPVAEPVPEPQAETETTNETEEKTEDPIETENTDSTEPIEDNTTEDENQPTEDNQTEDNNTEEVNTDEQKPDTENTDAEKTDSENTEQENTDSQNTDSQNTDTENPEDEQPDAEQTEDNNTTEEEETAAVKLSVSVEPEIILPGQEARWHFQAESEEKLALSWQLLKDGEEIKAGKFENEEKDYAFTPDSTGEYAFKLTATTVPEGENAQPVSKSKTTRLQVIEPPELAVSVTTEARSAFGGDAVSFTLSRSGNEYAQKASAAISAAQDGIIIYEANEFSDTVTVTPVILEKAGVISVKVILKDQFGQTAESSIDIPCAMHETEGRDNWEYMFKDVELTGEWPTDFLTIAKTQIGYKESEKDFVIREDGELQGWTRYGAKAGMPYEEWCAMFASFCLDYAKVPEWAVPRASNEQRWLDKLAKRGLYAAAREDEQTEADREYKPQPGDLIFFDKETDKDEEGYGVSDHVGIIARVDGNGWLYTIEGNRVPEVKEYDYSPYDEHIMGYGLIGKAYEEELARREAAKNAANTAIEPDEYAVIDVLEGSVPAGASVRFDQLSQEDAEALAALLEGAAQSEALEPQPMQTQGVRRTMAMAPAAAANLNAVPETASDEAQTGSVTGWAAFEIGIESENGAYTEPGLYQVTVTPEMEVNVLAGLPEGAAVTNIAYELYHIHGDEVELIDDLSVSATDGVVDSLTFVTESFSAFVLKYTVDFEYENNGETEPKISHFSIEGGTSITLRELIEVLGIIGDTNFETVDAFTAGIKSVEFSDPALVKVTKNLIGKDWTLESLQPFTSEETLTIIMEDETKYVVKVTDSQASGDLAAFVTDATLEIDGKTYGAGTTWNVRPDVDYRLTLNFLEKGSRQFPGGGEEITMAMPSGMTLEPGMSGSFDIPCGLAGTLTGNTWWVDGSGNLHIKFGDDPDDLLTRSSNIHFDLTIDAKFDGTENHFEFNNNVKRDASFDNTTDVDVQKSGSYNAATGKMEYTVTVKSTGKSENVTVSDLISGDMLTLDESSIVITPSNKTPSTQSTNSKGFTMTFGEMAHNETVTIKYTASVDTSKIGPGGKVTGNDGKNNVTVTNDDGKTDTDENITNTIKFSDIAKSSTSSEETADGEKVEMEWKITANEGQLGSIKGSKITDTIDHGSKDIMHYVVGNDGKLALSVKKIAPDGTSTMETVYVDVSKTYDQGPETWTWIPQDEGNYAYEITYKTLVTKQKENTTVKNNTSNESGGSTSGTGVVPGTNPGGGGGSSGADDIVGGKAAVAVTPEYIDWDIVIAIQPGDDFTSRFEIVDEIPNGAMYGRKFADTFDSILSVTGLHDDHEDYTYAVTKEDHSTLNPKQKDILTITFWQDKAHTDPGIDTGARTITVKIRTKNDPDWVTFADTAGGGEQSIYHVNSAKVNDSKPFTDRAAPLHTKIDKEKENNLSAETVDGVQLPRYEYSVTLTNVTELPVVITDTYNPDELIFVGEGQATGWTGHHGIAAAVQKNNLNNPDSNYHATFSADDEAGILTITANDLPKKQDGSFYEFYRIYYTMRVKNAAALDSFAQQAIANGGTYLIGNTAEWNGADDHVDIEYKVPGLTKEGYFSSSSNNRQYTFILDVNRNGLEMNGGESMDLLDSHTKNLSVDYSTIKVYKITDGQNYDDPKQYQLDASMLTNEVTWNFDANEGTFSIPDETHYVITYDALVIGSGNQEFKNEAELKGFKDSKEDKKDYGSSSHAGGSINQINLLKYENGQTSKGLQGATFQLFKGTGEYDSVTGNEIKEELKYGKSGTRDDGTTFEAGENITFTTGSNGTVLIALDQTRHGEQLDTGVHYYLKEVDSPAGYQIDTSVEYWEFTLTDDPDEVNYGDPDRRDERGWRQWIYFSYGDILKMANTATVEPMDVVVNKQWFDDEGNEITGDNLNANYTATIRLLRKTDDGPYVPVTAVKSGDVWTITECTSDPTQANVGLNVGNSWHYAWEDLPRAEYGGDQVTAHYAYKVEEVEMDGYVVSVSESNTATTKTYALKNYEVPNDKTTEITVEKKWLDASGTETTENLPESIQFYIYQVASKTPFTRTPTTGGSIYVIAGDSRLVNAQATDTDNEYGIYELQPTDGNWTTQFNNLPEVVTTTDGEESSETLYYAYYVKEVKTGALAGYTTTYTSNGTTRVITNREPLPKGEYIDVELEKKWANTEGTEIPAPTGASATFTVHQQKSTKSGVEGNLEVRLVDKNEELICFVKASDGNTLVIPNTYEFSNWSEGSQLDARFGISKKINWDYDWRELQFQNVGTLTKTWDGIKSSQSFTIDEIANAVDGVVTVKFEDKTKADFSVLPLLTNESGGTVTFSDYTETTYTRAISLPVDSNWSTTINNLIKEDEAGNKYRYYITEDSSTPEASDVTFVDGKGEDIKAGPTDPESTAKPWTSTFDEDNYKIVTTNKVDQQKGSLQIQKTGTVNNTKPTDANHALIDGEYSFTISGKAETVTAGNTVRVKITLEKGAATAAAKEGTSVPADAVVSIAEGLVTISGLPEGTYTVTENLTDDQKAAGISLVGENDIEITVSAKAEAIPTAGFVNNVRLTELNVKKEWDSTSPNNHPTSVTFKVYRVGYYMDGEEQKPASEGFYPDDSTTYTISGSEKTTVPNLPAAGTETVEGVKREVTYTYRAVEQPVQGDVVYWPSYTVDETNVTIKNTPVAEAEHKTEVSVSKKWLDADGKDADAAHAEDAIEFTLKQVPHTTEYVPVTLLYVNADGSTWKQQELFVKKGASLTFTFNKDRTLFEHLIELTVGNQRTPVGGTRASYTYTTPALNAATAITARQTFSITPLLTTYYDMWGDSIENLGFSYQWTSSVAASSGTLYTDYTTFYNAMAVDSNKGEANEGIYILEESSLTKSSGTYNGVLTGEWAAKFVELPQFTEVGTGYVVYTYEISELKVKPKDKAVEIVGTTDVEGYQGETTNYLVQWSNVGTSWSIINKEKPGINIIIKKVDNNNQPLGDAVFEIYKSNGSVFEKMMHNTYAWLDNNDQFTVPSEGYALTGLKDGTYQIKEITPPAGYVITEDTPVTFTVTNGAVVTTSNILKNGATYTPARDAVEDDPATPDVDESKEATSDTFTITNTPGVALPSTGGSGTALYTVGGLSLMSLAAMLYWCELRKRRAPRRRASR